MKLLLTGKNGQVGSALTSRLTALGAVTALGREELDLARPESIAAALEREQPDVVVNAAAYTAVDQAEAEPELALRVNGESPGILARWCAENDALLVHYSTDYVFDGRGERPWCEDDACNPLNVYGESKLAGERAIRDAGARHLILRTSWVYGPRGRNFLRSILAAAAERDELRIVDDQWGSPSCALSLAERTTAAVERVLRAGEGLTGTWHLSAGGRTTWFRFARTFLEEAVRAGRLERAPRIEPIGTGDWPTPAERPRFSVLDNRAFEQAFDLDVPSWESQLQCCLSELWREDKLRTSES